MKTIRTNCFETNSSSTHSFTVNAPTNLGLRPIQTFLPNEDGVIAVGLNIGEPDNSLMGKLSFLLSFAYHAGDQEGFDRVVKTVEDFTKIPVKATARVWETDKWVNTVVTKVKQYEEDEVPADEDEDDEDREDSVMFEELGDEFSSWTNEYGHGSVSEFYNEASSILESEQSITVFIFSAHGAFDSEAYYN